ncbi:hypothetical protein [Pontiella desulfatans]|nr:hypothetical protein [Pontiella desulfatans]
MSAEEVRELLMDMAEDVAVRKSARTASESELPTIFFKELQTAANISDPTAEQSTILRASTELLMKKLRVPFTSNLDDEALFRLFRRHIGEKIIKQVKPMLTAGYFMTRCDDEVDQEEERILTFFIKNLDVLEEVKKEFLAVFFSEAEALYKKAESSSMEKVLGKICASQDAGGKDQILRFTYSMALASDTVKRKELALHETLARVMKVAPDRVLEIRDDVEAEHAQDEDDKQLGKILGCRHFNELIVFSEVTKFSRGAVVTGVAALTGVVGMVIASGVLSKVDYKKLNAILSTLALKAEDEVREERIIEVRNIFEKLAAETGEMLTLCSNIHLYLQNMNKAYSEVAEQAWLKGLWNQISSENRQNLTAGGAMLTVVAHDVGNLLSKIVQHQQTLTTAIDEHFRLISLSEELQGAVKQLATQNKQLVEIVKEAESAGVTANAA